MAAIGSNIEIRPFSIDIPEEKLTDLQSRIAATRLPTKELVADRSQGVQLATVQGLARYWSAEYDWRKVEAKLNALPQFTTQIDGLTIHFIHVRSQHKDAVPLIMTHGWPGSVIELLETVGPLTNPTAHGGSADDAFDLVLPSLPGYGFSDEPVELGWDLGRTARAWAELMHRLGYTRYVAQGGDVGAGVTDAMSRQAPEGLIGTHTNLLVPALNGPMPTNTDDERAAAAQIATFQRSGNGYFVEMASRPQTIGYALLDSPIALATWMVDHDTDAYYKISHAFVDGQPSGNLTRDHILDNVTLYWLTGTGTSAARSYWEAYGPGTRRPRAASLSRRNRSRSDSPRSRERSGRPRAAGSMRVTRTSSTSTRWTRAATSPRGRSPSCSPARCGPPSVRCADRATSGDGARPSMPAGLPVSEEAKRWISLGATATLIRYEGSESVSSWRLSIHGLCCLHPAPVSHDACAPQPWAGVIQPGTTRSTRASHRVSGALGHETDVCSFDRDPNMYGICALESCRARQHTCSISMRVPLRMTLASSFVTSVTAVSS